MTSTDKPAPTALKIERLVEAAIFSSRWLIAPMYVALIFVLGGLVVVFLHEAVTALSGILTMTGQEAIMVALSLVDLTLAGNLLLIVIFSGYENFVSKIDTADHEDRPGWMGVVDFSSLKQQLFATIVAISAIAVLRAFISMSEGQVMPERTLAWLVGIHVMFVVSGLLLALTDRVKVRRRATAKDAEA